MRTIRITFTDIANLPGWHHESSGNQPDLPSSISRDSPDYGLLQLLRRRYNIQLNARSPDYVIYSVFGHTHLNFTDAVRIFFTGENVRPDFNICDYAFGFDYLTLGDRYCRLPHYLLYDDFDKLRINRRTTTADHRSCTQRKFCNFVYSNARCHPARDNLFRAISSYRHVDSAGAHLNNTGGIIGKAFHGNWISAKVDFQREYKFTIACENSSTPGYTTEKLVHALAADTVPIYWGNPEICREFNPKRFINCHEFSSFDSVCQRVKQLDQNDDLYLSVLNEPFFPDDRLRDDMLPEHALTQFAHIFDQPKRTAFRRDFHCWGNQYESELRHAFSSYKFVTATDPIALAGRAMFKCWKTRLNIRRLWFSLRNRAEHLRKGVIPGCR